jgi:hypothetical protein
MSSPFIWYCERCKEYVANRDTVNRLGQWWHWDPVTRQWCGPLVQERVD